MMPRTTTKPVRNWSGATLVHMPPTSRDDTVVFSVRMPRAMHQRLRAVAEADLSSVNRSVLVAVERYLAQMEGAPRADGSPQDKAVRRAR